MQDRVTFNQNDLVLNINKHYDPEVLNLDEWEAYLEVLCGDRDYQKEAIKNSIIFLAGGRYKNTERKCSGSDRHTGEADHAGTGSDAVCQ